MDKRIKPILDANLNRVTEGLRVIEEYARFISLNKTDCQHLAKFRRHINQSNPDIVGHLLVRDIQKDARAKEIPSKRTDISTLLMANFRRVQEGLRVLEEYTGDASFSMARYDMYTLEKTMVLHSLKPRIQNGIYLISDDIDILLQGLAWGVSLIQLRDKTGTRKSLLKKARHIQPLAKKAGIPFIINDYLDIALACDADGFHTGQEDLPIDTIRQLLGPHKLIGRTTHSIKQGRQAKKEGADYVSVGPIWQTPSKPGRKGIGKHYLHHAKTLNIPYVAIGGVDIDNIDTLLPFNPPLIGLIRDYQNIPEIQKKLKAFSPDNKTHPPQIEN